jgi:hypothetical protein
MPILNMVWWWKKWGNIWEPLNLTVTTSWLDATITWEDNEIWTIPPTTFQKSELVRKIGSAPTSPSDWTLVVTETVKDTYKTTWYVDQWLADWTTYYYRVFSYSDLWGISYCDAVSVTPSSPWQPWVNCVAYYPFDTDTNDAEWTTTFTVTTSWIALAQIWDINALYNDGSGTSNIDLAFTRANVTSIFCWAKWDGANWDSTVLWDRRTGWGYDQHRTIDAWGITPWEWRITRYDSWGYNLEPHAQIGTNWTCLWYIETTTWAMFYINWTLVASSNQPSDWAWLTYNMGVLSWINNGSTWRSFKGYMSKLVLYNAEKTEADYLAYYNKTKWDYWIS